MIGQMLAEAWYAMAANRLRTFLTMLGMVIGVSAVILMLAIGQGAQYQVDQSIASMGSNLFIVLSGSSTAGGVRLGTGAAPTAGRRHRCRHLTEAGAPGIVKFASLLNLRLLAFLADRIDRRPDEHGR